MAGWLAGWMDGAFAEMMLNLLSWDLSSPCNCSCILNTRWLNSAEVLVHVNHDSTRHDTTPSIPAELVIFASVTQHALASSIFTSSPPPCKVSSFVVICEHSSFFLEKWEYGEYSSASRMYFAATATCHPCLPESNQ